MSFLTRRSQRQRPNRHERIVHDPVEVDYLRKSRPTPHKDDYPTPLPSLLSLVTPVAMPDITAVIVNYRTLRLTQNAYRSLLQRYELPVVVVDNGSQDAATTAWIQSVHGINNRRNLQHGPALHAAIKERVHTPYLLTLDSDCIINHGGWLELMRAEFDYNDRTYAVGWLRYVDKFSGVPLEWHLQHPPADRFTPYIHPAIALYAVDKYYRLPPFMDHGAPALENMQGAVTKGYKLVDFPVFDYVTHLGAGTRRLYHGKWNPGDHEPEKPWHERDEYPL